ncbi:MAG: response regulator [Patescibacteria group bacterium]|nr:response regulator [Patescibacteria group bacterium]
MRFLIIDDEEICRELLVEMLEPLGLCDVAAHGEEAIEAVRCSLESAEPYDLICLDIMMPGLNGYAVLERIRTMETEQNRCGDGRAKVIMTTALADTSHRMQAFREGCESYLTKPFSENDLLRAMDRLGLNTAVCSD